MNINECLEKGYLTKIEPDKELIKKEIEESEYDFEKAKKTFDDKDYKWSIIKSYYAMFHVARALLFKLGLKEKRHFAISVVFILPYLLSLFYPFRCILYARLYLVDF